MDLYAFYASAGSRAADRARIDTARADLVDSLLDDLCLSAARNATALDPANPRSVDQVPAVVEARAGRHLPEVWVRLQCQYEALRSDPLGMTRLGNRTSNRVRTALLSALPRFGAAQLPTDAQVRVEVVTPWRTYLIQREISSGAVRAHEGEHRVDDWTLDLQPRVNPPRRPASPAPPRVSGRPGTVAPGGPVIPVERPQVSAADHRVRRG